MEKVTGYIDPGNETISIWIPGERKTGTAAAMYSRPAVLMGIAALCTMGAGAALANLYERGRI